MTNRTFGCKKYTRKVGILIAQLGTPDAPTAKALRPYLKQFLGDPRVIEGNRLKWWFVLNGIVLRTRPKRSAKLYQRIWGKDGSPLLSTTRRQTDAIRTELQRIDPSIAVSFGMRYGSPSLESGLDELIEQGCARILLFPMYPQYSATSTASTYDVVFSHLLKRRWVPTLRVAEPYFDAPEYIDALASTINESLAKTRKEWGADPERLMISYHGIPLAYVQKGDPYCCQCTETTRLLRGKLNLPANAIMQTYQSRFGKDPWLQPYTDLSIEALAKDGVKDLVIAAPGFTTDCLETIDELGTEYRHIFEEHGGKRYALVPCLNDDPRWIAGASAIISREISSWIDDKDVRGGVECPVAQVVGM